jgi:predicted ATP-dependent endonuclease of OLD family
MLYVQVVDSVIDNQGGSMRIIAVRIRNFRAFADETVTFEPSTCLVGPNGAGKSTVLAALNVFFQEASSPTAVTFLTKEDFHSGNTLEPVQITVTFGDLSERAKSELAHYVRHGHLVVTSVATFDEQTGRAAVQQFGERLVFRQFSPFFELEKNKGSVEELKQKFGEITMGLSDFTQPMGRLTKAAMVDALRLYEEARPQLCDYDRSSDHFYGASRGRGKLEPFLQWVYLPAVKDASQETEEAGNTALGKLLQRTVRQKVKFDEALEELRAKTQAAYDEILGQQQETLQSISKSLANRLALFAHPGASVEVAWLQGSDKSVAIGEPRATIKAQKGAFKGSMTRFGHGLQRSFLLAILQELASIELDSDDLDDAARPTLVLGCEEPELYQHPPQARHLAGVLRSLASAGNQIIMTTHSAYFASGEAYEEIRLVRRNAETGAAYVKYTDFARYAGRFAIACGTKPTKSPAARAALQAALRPEPAEMFFSQRLVLVEGIADRAYASAALHLEGAWEKLRRSGLHIIPTDGKSNILQLLLIAQELAIPTFVIFDADGHASEKHLAEHERDNTRLMSALGLPDNPFPSDVIWGQDHAIWPQTIEHSVKACFDKDVWERISNQGRNRIDASARLQKSPSLIGEILSIAWAEELRPQVLTDLVARLTTFSGVSV